MLVALRDIVTDSWSRSEEVEKSGAGGGGGGGLGALLVLLARCLLPLCDGGDSGDRNPVKQNRSCD